MFTTTEGIKRSIYGQTGNFQFNTNLIVDTLFGGLNVGVSGSGSDNSNFKINTFCNSGKIFDDSGRFVGVYRPNEQFNISGNVTSDRYDLFVNGAPVSFGNVKNTGIINYLYLKPTSVSCQYNLYANGILPQLSISNLICNTGDIAGTGYITNNGNISVKIFSGDLVNFPDGGVISLSGLFTGDLPGLNSGAYYIIPDGRRSFGEYIGNFRLYTNGGIFNYSNLISITGDEPPILPSLNLNGSSLISSRQSNSYTSNIKYLSSPGMPVQVSLAYVSGSGNFYKDIDVISEYSGNITGYIFNTGILSQYITGIGTGMGGQLSNTGSGFVSGYISGDLTYARGTFVWPYSSFVYGYATGIGYSGLGTGIHYGHVTGKIHDTSGIFKYIDSVTVRPETRTLNTSINSGPTGYIQPTGGIYWNTAMNLYNKFKITNPPRLPGNIGHDFSFIYGYHFASPLSLKNALLNFYSDYIDIGIAPPPKLNHYAVHITGKLGQLSQFIFKADSSNQTNVIYFDQMSGAQDLGIGEKVLIANKVTGIIQSYFDGYAQFATTPYYQSSTTNVSYFTGSGYYTNTGQGLLQGSGSVIDYTKTFTGSWNLKTGLDSEQVDYWAAGFYDSNLDRYYNNNSVNYINSSAFIDVTYNNSVDSYTDVALLTITGINFGTGLQKLISGNIS